MAVNIAKLPPMGSQMVDPKTGLLNPIWYRFFASFLDNALVNAGGAGYVVNSPAGLLAREIEAASNKITVTDGDGIADNTTIDVVDANLSIAGSQLTGTVPVSVGGTGQTTYTDGQLLIGKSTGNTLAKSTLTAGTGITVTNGSGAITITATGLALATGSLVNVQVFTASGTYTPTIGTNTAFVECLGGGGGGGATTSGSITGGAGGGGAYAAALVTGITGTYAIAIGAGGTGGSANTTESGAAGGDTTFDTTVVVAKGGSGGAGGTGASAGGAGGLAASCTGLICVSGGVGGTTVASNAVYAAGGAGARFGVSMPYGVPSAAAATGQANTGSGGNGISTVGTRNNGGSGLVIIWEYN